MIPKLILFLDFDGVICDSVSECFDSSIAAFRMKESNSVNISFTGNTPGLHERFLKLRPFIRNSEDYLFLLEIIEYNIEIKNQADFDRFVAGKTTDTKKEYKKLFYDARSSNLARDSERWYGLNPIYQHIIEPLRVYASNPSLYILSTKRSDFIVHIFGKNDVRMEHDRILFAGEKEKKLEIVRRFLDKGIGEKAIFVDDQVDHLIANSDSRITVCLPLWGYIDKNNLPSDDLIQIIDEDRMMEIFRLLD